MRITSRVPCVYIWVMGMASLWAADVSAQVHLQAPAQSAPGIDSALATITTDTGTFAPGRRDFSRYNAPKLCLAAARGTRNVARQSLEAQLDRDTLHEVRYDTIGMGAARAVARACMAQLLGTGAANQDLTARFDMSVLLADDTLALQTLDAQLAHIPVPTARSALRLAALTKFFGLDGRAGTWNVAGTRLSQAPMPRAADSMVAALDRDTSFLTHVRTRQLVLQYWKARDSAQAIQQAANDLLRLLAHAPPHALDALNVKSARYLAYQDLMAMAFFSGIDSMRAVAERAQRERVQLGSANGWPNTQDAAELSVHDVVTKLSPVGAYWDLQARPLVPQIDAAFWYPSNQSHIFPAPGIVTIVAAGGGIEMAIRIRQWLSKYDRNDLRVVVLDRTDDTAAYWMDPSGDFFNGPMTPSARAEQARWYYQEYHKLPVTVAVQRRNVKFEPWPDQRRTALPLMHPEQVMADTDPLNPGDVAVITRDGRLVCNWNILMGWHSLLIDRVIAWAVAQPPRPSQRSSPQSVAPRSVGAQ